MLGEDISVGTTEACFTEADEVRFGMGSCELGSVQAETLKPFVERKSEEKRKQKKE